MALRTAAIRRGKTSVDRPKYIFLNDEIVPWEDAKVHVSTVAFKFGAAVFEGLRGYWNEQQKQMYLFQIQIMTGRHRVSCAGDQGTVGS